MTVMDIPMLFAGALNSVRLGRRPDPPAPLLRHGLLPAELCAGLSLEVYIELGGTGWMGQAVMARQIQQQATTNPPFQQPSHHPLELSITHLQ